MDGLELRPDQIAKGEAWYKQIGTVRTYLTDAQASTAPDLYPEWKKGDWQRYTVGTIVRWGGERLWKFRLTALANESQNLEPGSIGSESLWIEIKYRDGYRIIPDIITESEKFAKGERGWWADGKLYESTADNNVYTPSQYAPNWKLVEDDAGSGTTDDDQPTDPTEPDEPITTPGTLANPIPYPETGGTFAVSNGKYYSYKGKVYLSKLDMPSCTWPPDTTGMWQWELVG